MLWCYSDYPSEIWDKPPLDAAPHERFFGLWRADGTPKPAARHQARYAGVTRKPAPISPEWIDADRRTFYDGPLATLKHLYGRYAAAAVPR